MTYSINSMRIKRTRGLEVNVLMPKGIEMLLDSTLIKH